MEADCNALLLVTDNTLTDLALHHVFISSMECLGHFTISSRDISFCSQEGCVVITLISKVIL